MITRYDGFTPVGEVEVCAFCGKELAASGAEVAQEELPAGLRREGERQVCYLCAHYVVNPFVQKCILHDREVEALDSCSSFRRREEDPADSSTDSAPSIF